MIRHERYPVSISEYATDMIQPAPQRPTEPPEQEMPEPEPPTPAELREQMEQAFQKRLRTWRAAHDEAARIRRRGGMATVGDAAWLTVYKQQWADQRRQWAEIGEEVAQMPTDLDPDDATRQIADRYGGGAVGAVAMRVWTYLEDERLQQWDTNEGLSGG